MPRPSRCRRICDEPAYDSFAPCGAAAGAPISLTLDEYESIRLIDLEKRTHAQCAGQMGVSRTTVTEIYERARSKLADCLVNGRPLQITGGHYRLCDGTARCCGAPCRKSAAAPVRTKGANSMRIAVTYENGNVFQHFGHTAYFKLYDVENGAVTAAQVIGTDGSGHGALAGRAAGGRADLRRHRRRRADGLEQRWHPPVCRRFRQRRRGRAGPVKRHAACRRPIQLQPPRPHLCAAFLQRRQTWLFRQLNLSF